MAPDAPAPTYDSHGNQVAEWYVRLGYDAATDTVSVACRTEAGAYHAGSFVFHEFSPSDLEDAIATAQREARVRGARRLF